MSHRFRKGKRPGKEALRILRLETELALWHLDRFEQDEAVHVHGARRSFRLIRSLLRLVRPAYAYFYEVENRFFREMGRALSAARDRDAVLEIANDLQVKQPFGPPPVMLKRLVQEASRLRAPVDPGEMQRRVCEATRQLVTAQRRYSHLNFASLMKKNIRHAINRTMRHVRQDYRSAAASNAPDDFHRLRKHARYAFNQMVMCEQIDPACTEMLQSQLRALVSVLGTHQDLCVLEELIPAHGDTLQIDNTLQTLIVWLEARKQELRDQALVQAQRMISGVGRPELRIADEESRRSA